MSKAYCLFIGFLFLSSCTTVDSSLRESDNSVLTGTWKQTSVECEGGALNQIGKDAREAFKSGQVVSLTRVENGVAIVDIKSQLRLNTPDSACTYKIKEKWSWSDRELEISESLIDRRGSGDYKCDGHLEMLKPRRHRYALEKDELRVFLTRGFDVSGANSESYCESGTQVIVYLRIF